jgi:hypothetical protein
MAIVTTVAKLNYSTCIQPGIPTPEIPLPWEYLENEYLPILLSDGQVDNTPISEYPVDLGDSFRSPTYFDDYYNRVHILPSSIAVGNLLSQQVRNVEVWNAHSNPRLLSEIDQVLTDGITLTSTDEDPPTVYAALESRVYQVTISTNGSPIIDARYDFNFPLGETVSLTITGRRVVIWPFIPQTLHGERLEWKTDVIPSFSNEQRLCLRDSPRQSLTHTFQMDEYQFSRAKAASTQWAHRVYGLPVWAELTRVGSIPIDSPFITMDTLYADYRENDLIIIWESDEVYVAVEITTITPTQINLKLPLEQAFSNAYIAPLRFCRTLRGMSYQRSTSSVVLASSEFTVTQNTNLAETSLPQYRSVDLLLEPQVILGSISERISRPVDLFDNGSGAIVVETKTDRVKSTSILTFDCLDRETRWTVRKWLHSRKGKLKPFWVPTWNEDLTLEEDITAAGTTLVARPISYSLYYGIKDIIIFLNDGSYFCRRILSASVNPSGQDLLSIDSSLGINVSLSSISRVCFLSHCRMDSDSVEIKHGYSGRASMSMPLVEVPE